MFDFSVWEEKLLKEKEERELKRKKITGRYNPKT
jgi:hypothetical protein